MEDFEDDELVEESDNFNDEFNASDDVQSENSDEQGQESSNSPNNDKFINSNLDEKQDDNTNKNRFLNPQSDDDTSDNKAPQGIIGKKLNEGKQKAFDKVNQAKQAAQQKFNDSKIGKGVSNAKNSIANSKIGQKANALGNKVSNLKGKIPSKKNSAPGSQKNEGAPQKNNSPADAVKDKAKVAAKKAIKTLAKNPYFWLVIGAAVIIIFIILIIASTVASDDDDEQYVDTTYNYSDVSVAVNNSDGTSTSMDLRTVVVKSAIYDIYSSPDLFTILSDMTEHDEFNNLVYSETAKDFFRSVLVYEHSRLIGVTGFTNGSTQTLSLSSDTITANYSSLDTTGLPITISESSMAVIYTTVKFDLLVDGDVSNVKSSITTELPVMTSSVICQVADNIKNGNNHMDALTTVPELAEYKAYNVTDYDSVETYTINKGSYTWPIGSSEPDSTGLYLGKPMAAYITSPFGERELGGKISDHKGIDIAGGEGTKNIIVSASDGEVVSIRSTCNNSGSLDYSTSCKTDDCCSNYVTIKSENNLLFSYHHLAYDSVVVNPGDIVVAGQKIANMGSTGHSTGIHLHFAIQESGVYVDPLSYVSNTNPRGDL